MRVLAKRASIAVSVPLRSACGYRLFDHCPTNRRTDGLCVAEPQSIGVIRLTEATLAHERAARKTTLGGRLRGLLEHRTKGDGDAKTQLDAARLAVGAVT